MRKLVMFLLCAALLVSVSACAVSRQPSGRQKYEGAYADVNGALAGTDDLDRVLTTDSVVYPENEKTVGIFYFLWLGAHGTDGPYDNNKIVQNDPDAILSDVNWRAAGGGAVQAQHFWGEPLFGYYVSKDAWVYRKHVQMLADAGIDYIVIDATNAIVYSDQFDILLRIWYEYYLQGVDVPKIAFYTHSSSAQTMTLIYNNYYANQALHERYPKLDELWFKWDGKPLIIGTEDVSPEMREYFTIKLSQWPNEAKKASNSWPWMEFSRSLKNSSVYYDENGDKMVINVSVAQHSNTVRFSDTAWYGGNDRTRSWHNGANDTSEDAVLHGYNFAEQWEFALRQDTPTVFITGWNEWAAQRQPAKYSSKPIVFIDCADPNNSRDIEPMRGLFGDNYYMQMIDYIRQYKGVHDRVNVGEYITIDVSGSFSQWDNSAVTALYSDYKNDIANRRIGWGALNVNRTGRNDFVSLKTAHDENNLYFYAQTDKNITADTDKNWMTLFIHTGSENNWYGYDYAVNLQGKGVLSRCRGGWDWEPVCSVDIQVSGNQLMLCVPYDKIGLDVYRDGLVDIQFKWADNYQPNDEGVYDIFTFYTDGDAAPIGRMNYVYSDVN